jgi:hypothetical protein
MVEKRPFVSSVEKFVSAVAMKSESVQQEKFSLIANLQKGLLIPLLLTCSK